METLGPGALLDGETAVGAFQAVVGGCGRRMAADFVMKRLFGTAAGGLPRTEILLFRGGNDGVAEINLRRKTGAISG